MFTSSPSPSVSFICLSSVEMLILAHLVAGLWIHCRNTVCFKLFPSSILTSISIELLHFRIAFINLTKISMQGLGPCVFLCAWSRDSPVDGKTLLKPFPKRLTQLFLLPVWRTHAQHRKWPQPWPSRLTGERVPVWTWSWVLRESFLHHTSGAIPPPPQPLSWSHVSSGKICLEKRSC